MSKISEAPHLTPVEGRFIFQIDRDMRVRFNADGWVEEIGKGGASDPLGTVLQGKPSTKRDDLFVRRFYDLYSRAVILDIFPKITNDNSGTGGIILFRDLDPDSHLYERVNKIIDIANSLGLTIKPL